MPGIFIRLGRAAIALGRAARNVAVGAPAPQRRQADTAAWAPYRKLLAVPIGALLGWAATKTGWGWIIANQEEITTLLIAYLVWRFPNATPPQVGR